MSRPVPPPIRFWDIFDLAWVETHFDWPCPNPDCNHIGVHYTPSRNTVGCIKCGQVNSATAGREHALYRMYDDAGQLLYVGISVSLGTRLRTHETSKDWWHRVARIDIERHPNRAAALEAELTAIQTEHPLHNVLHNTKAAR